VFFPNYSSGNVKTNSIWPVSACLAFFEAIWHFFTSGLAFFVHLDLATLSQWRSQNEAEEAMGTPKQTC